MKRLTVFVAAMLIAMFAYWLSGSDFQRSPELAFWFIGSFVFAGWAAACPYIKD